MSAIFRRLGDLIEREPVLFFGSTGLAGSIVTFLVALGLVHLSPALSVGITGLEDILVLIFLRSQVTPVAAPNLPKVAVPPAPGT